MDPLLLGTAAAFGLAASAGLNTTLPLFLVGMCARVGLLHLSSPYDALAGDFTLLALVFLIVLEIAADKISGIDTIVHAVQWPLAAAAGAILFASQNSVISWVSPELAIVVGLLTAGAVHGLRASLRPGVTATTLGLGNGVVSAVEDVGAVVLAVLSLFAPALAVLVLLGVVVMLAFGSMWTMRQGWHFTRKLWTPNATR